jgi:hypothetical protein
LNKIEWNPFRDLKLYPIDDEHVAELRVSIKEHDFLGGVKARRRNGVFELGCGHHRIAAARKALGTNAIVDIVVGDMDDDAMIRLMTDENALQSGTNPGAVMNEVAAVTRRVIEGLLSNHGDLDNCQGVARAFKNNRTAIKQAYSKLRNGSDSHLVLGIPVIRAYLGPHRGERPIREAIAALKQCGKYDDIVDEAIRKHCVPLITTSTSKAVATTKDKPKRRILDERCAHLFKNDNQFQAFREAVTSATAQKVIPVSQQYAVAKEIMAPIHEDFNKKHAGAPYVRKCVHARVQQGLRHQREINKEERERYLQEQREARIDDELRSANIGLRTLLTSLGKIADLAKEFPGHPKFGGFADRLDTLVDAIKQFSKSLK